MLDWRLTLYLKDEPVALFNLHQYKGVTVIGYPTARKQSETNQEKEPPVPNRPETEWNKSRKRVMGTQPPGNGVEQSRKRVMGTQPHCRHTYTRPAALGRSSAPPPQSGGAFSLFTPLFRPAEILRTNPFPPRGNSRN